MMPKTVTCQCYKCKKKYDVLECADGLFPLDGPELGCPRCGAKAYNKVFAVSRFVGLGRDGSGSLQQLPRAPDVSERSLSQSHFPYFDHGLGVTLQSPEHRSWCMTHDPVTGQRRDSPLVCVGEMLDGYDPIAIVDEQRAVSAEVDRKYAEYKAEMMSQPDTRRAWEMCELMNESRDYSMWGVEAPEAALNLPPEGETILQDLDGHLYTESGWASKEPQAPVPTALWAAGHDLNALPGGAPVKRLTTRDVVDAT